MAQASGTRVLGQQHIYLGTAGSTIAKGDLLQTIEATGTLTVDNAATNTAVFGFAKVAIATAAVDQVDRILAGDQFWFKIGTGTVVATTIGKFGDITDETQGTLTNSNNDFRVMGWDGATTNFAIVEFGTPESSTTTILA